MADRRTRDQLRHANAKLRKAIRAFVAIQDEYLQIHLDTGTKLPGDWATAYRAMKELMGESTQLEGDPHTEKK